jgi:hypothetical protein
MKNIGFSTKKFLIALCFTLLWFTAFSGRSEIICFGDPAGLGYGNFVIWNMDNLATSLSKLVDITKFCLDFSLSYLVTLVLFFIILRISKIKNSIFEKTKWFIVLLVCTILISSFFSIEFMFDVFFDSIDCERVPGTYSFGLDL